MELFISHYCSPFLRARDNFKASSTVTPEELVLKILEIFGFGNFCRKHNYLRLKKKSQIGMEPFLLLGGKRFTFALRILTLKRNVLPNNIFF